MYIKKMFYLTIIVFLNFFILNALKDRCPEAKQLLKEALSIGESKVDLERKELLYVKAIGLCKNYVEAHNNLGDIYEKQGQYDLAVKQYNKVIGLRPDVAAPYFGLGDVYFKSNRPILAIKNYKIGLTYDPSDKLSLKRLKLLKKTKGKEIMKAGTIRGIMSLSRGINDRMSLSFGEGKIPFDFNKYEIKEDAKAQLDEIGKALQTIIGVGRDIVIIPKKKAIFEIAGHTDIKGENNYNQNLSFKRAESVVNYLVEKFNIPENCLEPIGYGKTKLICKTSTDENCQFLNRRVEIIKKK